MSELEAVHLGPYETVLSHSCTDVSLYAPDLDLMAYMLQDLRALLRAHHDGRSPVVAYEPTAWEVHGMRRRTVVCEPEQIRLRDTVCIVGFFGSRRTTLPYESLDAIDVRLLDEFRMYPGILSYSSIELADDYWANLVVHSEPDDRETWRTSAAHVNAVALSPQLYTSVRIHNGHLPNGVAGNRAIELDSTKYWDYECEPVWRAERRFDPPLTRVRRQDPHLD